MRKWTMTEKSVASGVAGLADEHSKCIHDSGAHPVDVIHTHDEVGHIKDCLHSGAAPASPGASNSHTPRRVDRCSRRKGQQNS
jgi:hypothetical protein